MPNSLRLPLLRSYYLATPLFALVDLLWGAPIRVAFVEDPRLRLGYYGLCLLLAAACHYRPVFAPAVGLLESSLNLLLLVLSVMLPILDLPDRLLAGEPLEAGMLTPARVVNFALAAAILTASLRRSEAALTARIGARRR